MSSECKDESSPKQGNKHERFVYKNLGKSGLKVSNICLGGFTFGESQFALPGQSDEKLSHEIMDIFVEHGGNFFDTANVYGNGNSEKIIGTWLSKRDREQFVIATKCRFSKTVLEPKFPNCWGLSRKHIFQAVENSLSNLQSHYIDLYQMHCWDSTVPIEETLMAFNDLVRSGKILYFGVSNMKGWMLQKIVDTCKYMGLSPVLSLQQQYNLLCRESELEAFEVCEKENIGVLPWGALKSGLLTGKFKTGMAPAQNTRIRYLQDAKPFGEIGDTWEAYDKNEKYWKLMEELDLIAKAHDKTVTQVTLRWLLQKDIVTSVIIGAKRIDQLKENIGAAYGWELSSEEMGRLDAVSQYDTIKYPYRFIDMLNSK
ncbi:unnamed protein product [Acanthosepion pharaonis]|uniref:NADP-dependent oxidoreductase domain-containing protein n=1 Tax=Acanthosepion pharaonis TaxID=158019 RepID=A0A812CKZ4_ACAPH|nr:unnamed protein product [Sepia pharaonis]